jgi:hypothetical protein
MERIGALERSRIGIHHISSHVAQNNAYIWGLVLGIFNPGKKSA